MEKVSVVTPSYNSSSHISETIKSVISQSYNNWEMIIVDDCSNDNSVDVIQSFVDQDSRIKLIRLSENSGAAVARNTAIEQAEGRYIAFLDSDDRWLPNKLDKQIAFMNKYDYPFIYSAYEKINPSGEIIGKVGVPEKVTYYDLLKTNHIGCLTAIYDTYFFGKVYMPLVRKRQDLGLWLRLLKKTKYAYGINESLGQYCVRSDSLSANKIDAVKYTWRLYRDVENLNIIASVYFFSHYFLRGTLRTKFPKLARFLGFLNN